MSLRIAFTVGVLTLLPPLATGCLSPGEVVPINRYVIEPAIETDAVAGMETPDAVNTIGLRPLAAARPYSSRMAFREGDLSIGYYPEVQWAETPGPVVTRALEDALRLTRAFTDVGDAADMSRPDLILTGDIRKFYEDRTVDGPVATVEVILEVRESLGVEALYNKIYVAAVPLEGSGPAALAKAMNEAVARFATDAARDIAGAAAAPLD
jgi:ABC-type uncharacterized transport system auxiliary subunit